jgi:tetratricopeptide (TPR) repeat protein
LSGEPITKIIRALFKRAGRRFGTRRTALAGVTALFLAASVSAANPYGIPDDVDRRLSDGFHALFNLEFDKAQALISSVQDRAEEHPMVALAAAVVPWWKLTIQVAERDERASHDFIKASERCLKISEKRLSNDRRAEAAVALGTTLGLMSRWSAANRAWLAAYSRGEKSTHHLERALQKNAAASDAYMTLGTFDYARALIHRRLNQKITLNDPLPDKGLNELRRAYKEAPYFRLAAGLTLAALLANERPVEAIPLATELRDALPHCAFADMALCIALYNAGRVDDLEKEADAFLERVDSGAYDPWFRPQALFMQALVPFHAAKWRAAAKAFGEAADIDDATNPYPTWARLYQGYSNDAMGKSDRARTCYQQVLARPPRFASHEHARTRLEKPFTRNEVELRKLEL